MGVRLPRLCVSRVRVMPAIHTLAFVSHNIFGVCACVHSVAFTGVEAVVHLFSYIFSIFRPCVKPRGCLPIPTASLPIAQLLLQLLILQLMLMSQRHARRRRVFFCVCSPPSPLVRARVYVACVPLRDVHSRTRYRDIPALIEAGSTAACFSTGAAWTAPRAATH